MIPDKIYVGVGTLSSIQPAEEYTFPGWQEKAYSQIRNEQYIRKDALLDWVKLAYGKVSMNPFDCSEAFEELIEKIEAL